MNYGIDTLVHSHTIKQECLIVIHNVVNVNLL